MKIAICYSGMARTIQHTFENHKSMLIDKYDCDIFFSFWDCWGYGDVTKKYDSILTDILTESDKQSICNLLSPVQFEFESFSKKEPILCDMLSAYNQNFPFCKNVLSMHYKIYKCMNLVHSSLNQYDVVFRLRADHILHESICIKPIHKNSFYTNLHPTACNISGLNDQIGYGDIDSMTLYSGLYSNFKSIFSQFEIFNPEVIFKKYIDSVNLQYYHDNLHHQLLTKEKTIR